jgi:SIR2-like domain/4-hydroxyphenylacetate 3-hydroxylase N terminal
VPNVFPQTIYQRAAEILELEEPGSFPTVIGAFVQRYGRRQFVQMVKAKFDYVDSFWTLRHDARRFHKELATMPYLVDIVTTNWDPFFEEECAATPFVTGDDIALWNMPGRRVLKIHGSMTNLGSIVATEKDYKESLKSLRTGVLGGLLTELLATRTLVFIGYSLRDWNFRRLYSALRKDMGSYSEKAYFVSPFGADEDDEKEFDLVILKTSGVRFLRDLKLANLGSCFIEDSTYDRIAEYYDEICVAEQLAKTVPHKKYPSVLYCWSFHDGARDACRRIQLRRPSGEYSSRQHVELVGPNGLLNQLTKNVLETALDAEMAEHLGYDKHDLRYKSSIVHSNERCLGVIVLMSAAEYRDSLRAYQPRVYVDGKGVDCVADSAALAPGIAAIGVTYDLALQPQYADMMTATNPVGPVVTEHRSQIRGATGLG